MNIEVSLFGRWNGDSHDYIAVVGKLATAAWIAKSPFEMIPHSRSVEVDESLVVNGVYSFLE